MDCYVTKGIVDAMVKNQIPVPRTLDEAAHLLDQVSDSQWRHLMTLLRAALLKNSGGAYGMYHAFSEANVEKAYIVSLKFISKMGGYPTPVVSMTERPYKVTYQAVKTWIDKEVAPRHHRLYDVPKYETYINEFIAAEKIKQSKRNQVGKKPSASQSRQKSRRPASRPQPRADRPATHRPKVTPQSPSKSFFEGTLWFWLVAFVLMITVAEDGDRFNTSMPRYVFFVALILTVALYTFVASGRTNVGWRRYVLFLVPVFGLGTHPFWSIVAVLCMVPVILKQISGLLLAIFDRE